MVVVAAVVEVEVVSVAGVLVVVVAGVLVLVVVVFVLSFSSSPLLFDLSKERNTVQEFPTAFFQNEPPFKRRLAKPQPRAVLVAWEELSGSLANRKSEVSDEVEKNFQALQEAPLMAWRLRMAWCVDGLGRLGAFLGVQNLGI